MKNEIFLINEENLIKAGCIDPRLAIEAAEDAIVAYSQGKVLFPDKVSQIFDDQTQDRINCLPATIADENVCGVKWVSVFPSNAAKSVQNLSAVILLSNTENGFPKAFLEATACSNLRTAAVSAIAAKYLAPKNPVTVGFVGAGQQARYHFAALKNVFPQIKRCLIASRTFATEKTFAEAFRTKYRDVEFIECNGDYEKVVRGADVLISAISGQAPIIKSSWIHGGMLYLHIGGWEDEYEVPLMADKIVCDNWDSVKHRTQTISRLYKAGRLKDEDIYCDIDALVSGNKIGRENSEEFIYFNAVGLSYVDVALANRMYKECRLKGEGTFFTLSSGETVVL